MKEKVLRIIQGQSQSENFVELIDSPGWCFINSLKLPTLDKFMALAIAQSHRTSGEVKREAGLMGLEGRNTLIKRYWRLLSKKLIGTPTYKAKYKEQLDKEWTINESLGFAKEAAKGLLNNSKVKEQEAYKNGKLPIEHLRMRARLFIVRLFIDDLVDQIEKRKITS